MSSLPTYSNMPFSLLDRTESLPAGDTAKLPSGAPIALPTSPVASVPHIQQPAQYMPNAYGFNTPFSTPMYNNPIGSGLNQGYTEGLQAQYGFSTASPTMQSQVYGYNMLPTIPPRYSVTGTSFAPAHRGCISPLDLMTSPSAPAFTVSAPNTGTALTFNPSHLGGGSSTASHAAFASTLYTPGLAMRSSVPPPALIIPTDTPAMGIPVGLATPVTPFGSDSAPETSIESPISESDDELEEIKGEEDDDMPSDPMPISEAKSDKVKVKLAKGKNGKKNVEGGENEKDATTGKKRCRTAQACEKCRIRKARVSLDPLQSEELQVTDVQCFGGNPCQRCTKRGFVCEFTPSRVRAPAPKAETKPKIRRHSMHTVGGSGSAQLAGQPGVNGMVALPTAHAPLSRVQSHNHVYTQARNTPYTRPPIAHSHSMSAGVNVPIPSPSFAPLARAPVTDLPGTINPYLFGSHAHTQPMSQIPLPELPSNAQMSTAYRQGFPAIPSFGGVHSDGASAPVPIDAIQPSTTLTPAFASSSLGLTFGASLPNPSLGQGLLGLGLEIDDDAFESSPSDHSSDVPALSATSASSGDASFASYPSAAAWSGALDSSTLPTLEEDMFSFSPVSENEGIQVVGWDDEPAMGGMFVGEAGDQGNSLSLTLGQQVEGVRDAAARQLYGVSGAWYGTSR
jgi:hypothetical protein